MTTKSVPTRFRRLFSANFRKNLTLPLASMPVTTDFVHATRGDPCPLLEKTGNSTERTEHGVYRVSSDSGSVTRFLCAFAPFATYDISVGATDGEVGFSFRHTDGTQLRILFSVHHNEPLEVVFQNGEITERFRSTFGAESSHHFLVSCRNECFDCYLVHGNGYPEHLVTWTVSDWHDFRRWSTVHAISVGVTVCGCADILSAKCYMDCGLRQADIRPIRLENGRVMEEHGKIYLTMSVRMEAGGYQGVFSWIPGTEQFALVGALFFDRGDDILANDVASSIVYHRPSGMWYLWVCSFTHGHVLAHTSFEGDPRFGVNRIDYHVMETLHEDDDDTVFRGKPADEDPDFLYDEKTKLWYMTICRATQTEVGVRYRYFLFSSDSPFDGYRFVTKSENGDETGGSLLLRSDGLYFVCGSSFDRRAQYHIYHLPDMAHPTQPTFDYDDGGFRGWGTYIPILRGTREIFYHLTFDRERGSDYNWSYGNLYCFVADGN